MQKVSFALVAVGLMIAAFPVESAPLTPRLTLNAAESGVVPIRYCKKVTRCTPMPSC